MRTRTETQDLAALIGFAELIGSSAKAMKKVLVKGDPEAPAIVKRNIEAAHQLVQDAARVAKRWAPELFEESKPGTGKKRDAA